MADTARQRVMWGIGILVVLLYALIPVMWIASLSVKPVDKLTDRKFFSGEISFENYESIFKRRHLPRRAGQLDRDRADRDADLDLPSGDGRLRAVAT